MRKTSGLSLLLLIFLSLCLITFSLLSVSESKADQNLSQRSADRTTEYYEAVTRANSLLSDIDTKLADILISTESARDPAADYLEQCSQLPAQKSDGELSWISAEDGKSGTLEFQIPVREHQLLRAVLLIRYPESEDDTLYEVIEWKIVNTRDWNPDTSLNVLRTETEE